MPARGQENPNCAPWRRGLLPSSEVLPFLKEGVFSLLPAGLGISPNSLGPNIYILFNSCGSHLLYLEKCMAYPFLGVTLRGPAPDMPVASLPRWHPGTARLQARQGRPRWCQSMAPGPEALPAWPSVSWPSYLSPLS